MQMGSYLLMLSSLLPYLLVKFRFLFVERLYPLLDIVKKYLVSLRQFVHKTSDFTVNSDDFRFQIFGFLVGFAVLFFDDFKGVNPLFHCVKNNRFYFIGSCFQPLFYATFRTIRAVIVVITPFHGMIHVPKSLN